MKRVVSLVLVLCFLLMPTASASVIESTELEEQIDAGIVINIKLQETLDAYFDLRNEMLSGQLQSTAEYENTLSALSTSQSLNNKTLERLSAAVNLARYHSVYVVDSSIRNCA